MLVAGQSAPVSGGWTFFHPFNPTKGGLDAQAIWNEDGNQPDIDDAAKTYFFKL